MKTTTTHQTRLHHNNGNASPINPTATPSRTTARHITNVFRKHIPSLSLGYATYRANSAILFIAEALLQPNKISGENLINSIAGVIIADIGIDKSVARASAKEAVIAFGQGLREEVLVQARDIKGESLKLGGCQIDQRS